MNECSSIGAINTSSLSDQTKFRLNEIIKVEDYFNSENQGRKIISKKLSKYIAAFNYFDEALIFYLQQVEEYLSFLLQVVSEFLQE